LEKLVEPAMALVPPLYDCITAKLMAGGDSAALTGQAHTSAATAALTMERTVFM
jgi:hypothetical protein